MRNAARKSLAGLLAAAALAAPGPAPAADPAKVFRYAFPIAETSLDPQKISDLYSNILNAVDLRRRRSSTTTSRGRSSSSPTRSPRMPEISAGRPHLHPAREAGHLLRRRPGLQGEEARAGGRGLRLLDQAAHGPEARRAAAGARSRASSPAATRRSRRRARPTASTTTRPSRGCKALDRYTFQIRLTKPYYNFIYNLADCRVSCAVAREVVEHYGDDIGCAPGGHRPLPARLLEALLEDRLRGQPGLPRGVLRRRAGGRTTREGQAILAQLQGQAPADGRPGRGLRHRGDAAALARLPQRGARPHLRACPRSSPTSAWPNNRLAPNLAQARHPDGAGARARPHLRLLQHGGPRRRRLHAGEGGAAPRDLARLQHARRDRASCARARRSRRTRPTAPAWRATTRTSAPRATEYNSPKAQGAARHVRLRRPRRRRLPRDCPTARPLVLQNATRRPAPATSRSTSCGSAAWTTSASSMTFRKAKWPDLLKESNAGKLHDVAAGRRRLHARRRHLALRRSTAPTPGFKGNRARFRLPAYDRLYEQARVMPDGARAHASSTRR